MSITTCNKCGTKFERQTKAVNYAIKNNIKIYCSRKCKNDSQNTSIKETCTQCTTEVIRSQASIKRGFKPFCSKSCAATYRNTHKTTGYKVSKLEKWIQIKLIEKYPDIKFIFNSKDIINSELDIYIPSLKLAFELNGIFHYEPIFGQKQLDKVKNNDNRKFQACCEYGISLCIIDTSQQKYVKESTSKPYLDIIINIIEGCMTSADLACT